MRKTNLARLLARRTDGIFVADCDRGEIAPDLFRKACEFGLEGIVSKRSDRPYPAGRSKDWIKVKNRSHSAMKRELRSRCASRTVIGPAPFVALQGTPFYLTIPASIAATFLFLPLLDDDDLASPYLVASIPRRKFPLRL